MKIALMLWAATSCFALSLHASPSGTVNFSNRGFNWDAPVLHADGITRIQGDGLRAQLWAGPAPDQLQATGEPVPFRSGALAGYFFGGSRQIPTVPAGDLAFVQVRVWDSFAGFTFEEAFAAGGMSGMSDVFTALTGGAGAPPSFPANLTGLSSFQIEGVGVVRHPASQTAFQGAQVQFEIEVVSSGPAEFQWQWNGVDLPGATTPVLHRAAQPEFESQYRVVVTTGNRALLSQVATLTVIPVPSGAVLYFGNRSNDTAGNAPVLDAATGQPISGDFVIQLFAGISPEDLLPASDPTLLDGGANAGFWEGAVLSIPEAEPGQEVFVQIRAWESGTGATYEEALDAGSRIAASEVCSMVAGGNGSAPAFLPPDVFKLTFEEWEVVEIPHTEPPFVVDVIPLPPLVPVWPDEVLPIELHPELPILDDPEFVTITTLPILESGEYNIVQPDNQITYWPSGSQFQIWFGQVSLISTGRLISTGDLFLGNGIVISPTSTQTQYGEAFLPGSTSTAEPSFSETSLLITSLQTTSLGHFDQSASRETAHATSGTLADAAQPPRLASALPGFDSRRSAPRGKLLRVSESPGALYEIEASTDFRNWFPIATLPSESGRIDLTSLPQRAEPMLFYRARALDRDTASLKTGASAALASPARPSAAVRITNARRQSGQFTFEVESGSGEEWQVEYTDSLASPSWKPLHRVSPNPLNSTVTDPASAPAERYYRVRTP